MEMFEDAAAEIGKYEICLVFDFVSLRRLCVRIRSCMSWTGLGGVLRLGGLYDKLEGLPPIYLFSSRSKRAR